MTDQTTRVINSMMQRSPRPTRRAMNARFWVWYSPACGTAGWVKLTLTCGQSMEVEQGTDAHQTWYRWVHTGEGVVERRVAKSRGDTISIKARWFALKRHAGEIDTRMDGCRLPKWERFNG